MEHRDQGDYWQSTSQTAMVIHGLVEYLKHSGELAADNRVQLFLNDQKIDSYRVESISSASQTVSVSIDSARLGKNENTVRLIKQGPGSVYWSATAEYFTSESSPLSIEHRDLNIRRECFKVTRRPNDGSTQSFLAQLQSTDAYERTPLDSPVKVGDLLAVHVVVKGQDWKYLMIEDPIPAGTELIESGPALQSTFSYNPDYSGSEFHDDRASFFRTELHGEGQFMYFLRVTNPGEFEISPASVESMYELGTQATTTISHLSVER
jgi:uncharacterized protein YfaS (alpha-2-macroglobulin family)